jgi:hypothetical protein
LFGGPRIPAEGQLHDGRQLALGFHGFHQSLGNLPCTAPADVFTFRLGNPFCDLPPP